MLTSLKKYIDDLFNSDSGESAGQEKRLELATAVLMIEISLADDHIDEREREEIRERLTTTFDLNTQEIDELIELAEKEVDLSVSLHEFTRLLTDTLSMDDRVNIVGHLWRIAYADSVLDKYEEYYIRKIADLLYISHADYIKAKHDAAD